MSRIIAHIIKWKQNRKREKQNGQYPPSRKTPFFIYICINIIGNVVGYFPQKKQKKKS